MELSKEIKQNITLLIIFISAIVGQFIYLNALQNNQVETIRVEYYNPELNESISFSYNIEIVKPKGVNLDKYPAAILLHGDHVDSRSLNTIKMELLQYHYAVILLDIDFSHRTFFQLNSSLNYILTREDINHSQIGIIGHSHGSHYAFLFGIMRNDSINAIVVSNMGAFGQIYLDYYDYFHQFIDINNTWEYSTFLSNYKIDVEDQKPRNMLIYTNFYNPQRRTTAFTFKEDLTLWEFEQQNVIYGDFSNGTAKELHVEESIFYHSSGLFDPKALNYEITWFNTALNHSIEEIPYWQTVMRIVVFFIFVITINLSGILLIGRIFALLPSQKKFIKEFLNRIKQRNWSQFLRFKGKTEEEPPKNVSDVEIVISRDPLSVSLIESQDSSKLVVFESLKKVFRAILFSLIGGNIFLYAIYFVKIQNIVFPPAPIWLNDILDYILYFNESLSQILYFGPLTFGIMYIWFLVVFFYEQITLSDIELIKTQRTNKKELWFYFFIILEIALLIWVFGNFLLYNWSGFNINNSYLNVILRFSVIFYLNSKLQIYFLKQKNKGDLKFWPMYIKLSLISIALYFPIMAIPDVYYMYYFFNYYWFYFIPFVFQFFILPILVLKNINPYITSFINFYIFLLWTISIFF